MLDLIKKLNYAGQQPTVLVKLPHKVRLLLLLLANTWLSGVSFAQTIDLAKLAKDVEAQERAFAQTMARRDFAAFGAFLAEEAIFLNGNNPLRGRAAINQFWAQFYKTPQAPFSWEPDRVEVLPSGTLAMTQGPVRDPSGKTISRFSTVWRLEAPGQWRVVFDKGEPICEEK